MTALSFILSVSSLLVENPGHRTSGPSESPVLMKKLAKLPAGSKECRIEALAFSPDGRVVAAGMTGEKEQIVAVWDVSTRKLLATLSNEHLAPLETLVFSSDGKLLTTMSSATVRLWEVGSWKESGTIPANQKNREVISDCDLARDGKTLALGVWRLGFLSTGELQFWDSTKVQLEGTLKVRGPVRALAYSRDGKSLAVATAPSSLLNLQKGATQGFELGILDLASKKLIKSVPSHRVMVLKYSPDGRLLAGGGDFPIRTVQVWDATTLQERFTLEGHEDPVRALAFAPGRSWLASADTYTVKIWDTTSGKELTGVFQERGAVGSVAFSPDGGILATGLLAENALVLWKVTSRR
jgi:WD40 repeat protein